MTQSLETLIQELKEKIDRCSILESTLTPSYTEVAGPHDTPETGAERLRNYLAVRESQLAVLVGSRDDAAQVVAWSRRTAGNFVALGQNYETSLRALLDPKVTELVARLRKDLSRLEAQR